jgi:hypothetical protein
MDILAILSQVNKIGLVIFVITLASLCYEFYVFYRDKKKKLKPNIPQLNTQVSAKPASIPLISQPSPRRSFTSPIRSFKPAFIIAGSIVMLSFLGFIAFKLSTNDGSAGSSMAPVKTQAQVVPTNGTTTSPASSSRLTAQTTPTAPVATTSPQPVSTTSGALALAASPTSSASDSALLITPTTDPLSTDEAALVTSTIAPTAVSELPTTADKNAVPYTLFIFLGAMLAFYIAFLY